VQLDLVHRTMERQVPTNIIFLDACRNNPLARNLARAMGTRSTEIGRGLAPVESGVGTLISFSTQPGNIALDGKGRNSPFAGALAKRLASSSDDLSALLIDVRNDVRKETENKQIPWEHSALTARFYFRPGAPDTLGDGEKAADRSEWAIVRATDRLDSYRAYVRRRPNGLFVADAQARISELARLAERWQQLKASRNFPSLKSFVSEAKGTEFGAVSTDRLQDLEAQEAAAWHEAAARQRLALYEAFAATWEGGNFAGEASKKMEELRLIHAAWRELTNSESQSELEAFILKHGWSEYGAEATARLVSLRRERDAGQSDSRGGVSWREDHSGG
jgi:uncharacterized caspase-like protein